MTDDEIRKEFDDVYKLIAETNENVLTFVQAVDKLVDKLIAAGVFKAKKNAD